MKARKVGAIKFRSGSAYAAHLLQHSKMTDSEIARKAGIKPQTVAQKKRQMLLKGLMG